MSRGSHHHCAVRTLDDREREGPQLYIHGQTWCGKYGLSSMSMKPEDEDPLAFARRMADCPKCSAAMGKVRLKQIADRVTIEPMEIPSNSWGKKYKSCHRLIIDGELVGHIIMDNGWGTAWELRELTDDTSRDFGGMVSHTPNIYHRIDRNADFQPVHTRSKEMLASAALRLRDKGELLTLAEQEVRREENRVRRAEEDRQREIDRAEAARVREERTQRENERRELALDFLNWYTNVENLTNSQRAGSQAALDIIMGKPA